MNNTTWCNKGNILEPYSNLLYTMPHQRHRWAVDISHHYNHDFKVERQSFDNWHNPNYGQPLNDTHIEIYVDASVNYTRQIAGCGMFITDTRDGQFAAERYFLGEQSSVQLSETVAIYMASTWLINNPAIVSGSTVAIYSDSQNSIKDLDTVLKHPEFDAATKWDIPQLYNDVLKTTVLSLKEASMNCRVTLRWIKAHAGHMGNHIADYYANLGAQGTEPPFNILSMVKRQPKNRGRGA